jgi:hypothetical protein
VSPRHAIELQQNERIQDRVACVAPAVKRVEHRYDTRLVRPSLLRPAHPRGEAGTTTKPAKRVRCAAYTRVSTEYIRSQAHDGWTLLRARYDAGGYSGGSTDRPALQPFSHTGSISYSLMVPPLKSAAECSSEALSVWGQPIRR